MRHALELVGGVAVFLLMLVLSPILFPLVTLGLHVMLRQQEDL